MHGYFLWTRCVLRDVSKGTSWRTIRPQHGGNWIWITWFLGAKERGSSLRESIFLETADFWGSNNSSLMRERCRHSNQDVILWGFRWRKNFLDLLTFLCNLLPLSSWEIWLLHGLTEFFNLLNQSCVCNVKRWQGLYCQWQKTRTAHWSFPEERKKFPNWVHS